MKDKQAKLHVKAKKLPILPGVYLMKDVNSEIIYVGKAKALKNRVSSYFISFKQYSAKISRMLEVVDDFDFIVTSSEFEALILECSLIKQHKPKYNTMLRDDKGYSYILIGNNSQLWNKITPVKQWKPMPEICLGPFVSGNSIATLVERVNLAFLLPTCNRRLKKGKISRPCLNYHINQCCAPCGGKVDETDYEKRLKDARKTLESGKKHVIAQLKQEMRDYAKKLEFEKAAMLRDIIVGLEKLKEEQHIILKQKLFCDVFALFAVERSVFGAILSFRAGRLKQSHNLAILGEFDEGTIASMLVQYYLKAVEIPEYVVVENEFIDTELVTEFLTKQSENFVGIVTTKGQIFKAKDRKAIGIKSTKTLKAIYNLALENAKQGALKQKKNPTNLGQSLAHLLKLKKEPRIIEVFDISNIGSSVIVGSMVTLKDGLPDKSRYRRFKIRSLVAQDDYGSMREVLFRRFKNFLKQKKGFEKLPDLVLVDGGHQHVAVAERVLEELKIDLEVAGLVKDERHRTRAVIYGGAQLEVEDDELFRFLARAQDEAHRFAITYARKAHKNISFRPSKIES